MLMDKLQKEVVMKNISWEDFVWIMSDSLDMQSFIYLHQ